MTDSRLLESLRRAVAAAPEDLPLRLHLAEALLAAGVTDEAVQHVAVALQQDPGSEQARALMARAMGVAAPPSSAPDDTSEEQSSEQAAPPPRFDWRQANRTLVTWSLPCSSTSLRRATMWSPTTSSGPPCASPTSAG